MLHIKEVISTLCKYLNITIGSTLEPDYFRLAKYDKCSEDIINGFLSALDKLTYFAVKDLNSNISLNNFDKCTRIKLRLAYLQYPALEIYSFTRSEANCSSRILLFAIVWVITKYDVPSKIIKLKLLNSSLGREFSKVDNVNHHKIHDIKLLSVQNQINNLLQKANKLSSNLKAISELYVTKINLMTKVHNASMSVSGLPHLSVSEMALIKRIATHRDKTEPQLEKVREMLEVAGILNVHLNWIKSSHIFYSWMGTVFDELEKTNICMPTPETITELSKFIYLLRHIVKKRLSKKFLKNESVSLNLVDCPTRLLRVQNSNTEADTFINENIKLFNNIDDSLRQKRTEFEIELKTLLKLISNCVHV